MLLDEYQQEAIKTAIYDPKYAIVYPALGLGEAGEIQGKVKKVLRDSNGIFTEEIKKELAKECGDLLWYISLISRDLGYNLDTIAQMNIKKLKDRKERGVISGSGDNR